MPRGTGRGVRPSYNKLPQKSCVEVQRASNRSLQFCSGTQMLTAGTSIPHCWPSKLNCGYGQASYGRGRWLRDKMLLPGCPIFNNVPLPACCHINLCLYRQDSTFGVSNSCEAQTGKPWHATSIILGLRPAASIKAPVHPSTSALRQRAGHSVTEALRL